MDLVDEILAESSEQKARVPNDEELGRLAVLSQEMHVNRVSMSELAKQAEALDARFKDITEHLLPALMQEIGMRNFQLNDGTGIEINQITDAYISREHADEAHAWLEENNAGDLIKNTVKISFGKGDDEKARKIIASLEKKGYSFETARGVHPMTLKAYVREQLEAGAQLPECLGVYQRDVAAFSKKKSSRRK